MASKYDPRNILGLLRAHEPEFDLQAGSWGMSPAQAVARYFKSPGHLLAVLRFFRHESLPDVAKATQIPSQTLEAYEKGQKQPSLKDLPVLATHYGADLRVLLEVFGHVASDASEESMGIAAKFSGELSPAEKVSLREFIARFSRSKKGV